MCFFVAYTLTFTIWATACYHSYYLNMSACALWLIWSCYNGANFYMESFSRKYEKQLDDLQKWKKQKTTKIEESSPKKATDTSPAATKETSPDAKEKKEQ